MAFPTSGLTNNQVHKEGNRAFVYDSALGVWDQVRETDRTENKILQGEIGAETTFPTGHIIQTTHSRNGYAHDVSSASYAAIFASSGVEWRPEITTTSASSKVLAIISILMKGDAQGQEDGRGYLQLQWDIGGAGFNTIDEMDEITGNYDRGGSGIWSRTTVSWTRLLSPAAVAIIRLQFNMKTNTNAINYHGASGCFSNVILMEIAG